MSDWTEVPEYRVPPFRVIVASMLEQRIHIPREPFYGGAEEVLDVLVEALLAERHAAGAEKDEDADNDWFVERKTHEEQWLYQQLNAPVYFGVEEIDVDSVWRTVRGALFRAGFGQYATACVHRTIVGWCDSVVEDRGSDLFQAELYGHITAEERKALAPKKPRKPKKH